MTTELSIRLTRMCHVLQLNRSLFYKWGSAREKRRLKMQSEGLIGIKIRSIFNDELGLYGAKRIAASLNDDTDLGPINGQVRGSGVSVLSETRIVLGAGPGLIAVL